MPKGLYFTAVNSFLLSSFFSTPNLWGHWMDLYQTWTHIHFWLLFEKFGLNCPQAFTPTGWGQKNPTFLGPTLNFDWTYLCNGTYINNCKESYHLQGLPYMPPNFVNFGSEMAENSWRVFAHPLKFLHFETLPALPHGRYITDSRQTLARVM